MNSMGRVTLPAETGFEKDVLRLRKFWGADAVRDSDGTQLDDSILNTGLEVYSTVCLIRQDNEWAKANEDCLQQIYLMSEPRTASGKTLEIDPMAGYYKEQFRIDLINDPHEWWEVRDRTTNEIVPISNWNYRDGKLVVENAKEFHKYTVAFLAYQIWEPVSMYNHKSNGWTSEHKMPVDPRKPQAREHLLSVLKDWLINHKKTDVVRFTTFCYNFDLIYGEDGKEKHVDWFGYTSCVSPLAIKQFEKEYGYKLTPEFFVNKGYYNTPFLVPSKQYLDWQDFNQRFVSEFAKDCVKLVHDAGKKAIMFLGDHWAGTEPYGKYFGEIGLDMVVGAAGDGVTTRMITDIPISAKELRFYPYFFPDIFCEGGDPLGEMQKAWQKSRRAIMRSPADRMGFGGYLSLAVKFPDFENYVAKICDEFRMYHDITEDTKPYSATFKIYVLNSWGKKRSWMTHQIAHSLWNQKNYSYLGVFEALSGLPFDIEFINFDDIRENGIPKDAGVIINVGDCETSWSGGENWADEKIVTAIRKWVANGGGFIGVGEPTAFKKNGSYFQLSDVLGVDKELGFTLSDDRYPIKTQKDHFILKDTSLPIDYGEGMNYVFVAGKNTKVLDTHKNSCDIAVNTYFGGRSVYISGLPYNLENQRILLRAIFWAASKENELNVWFSSNIKTECYCYPEVKKFAVVNNSNDAQETKVMKKDGTEISVSLKPLECKWFDI